MTTQLKPGSLGRVSHEDIYQPPKPAAALLDAATRLADRVENDVDDLHDRARSWLVREVVKITEPQLVFADHRGAVAQADYSISTPEAKRVAETFAADVEANVRNGRAVVPAVRRAIVSRVAWAVDAATDPRALEWRLPGA